ncbi:MAG: TRAP transporter small permease subunit [Alphaproteobacteria bacterium]|nr:TRAP transporter small permease subunit [Alphaproteobacteria bacterium]
MADTSGALTDIPATQSTTTALWRAFGWAIVVATFVFLLNNYLIFWRGWPGVAPMLTQLGILAADGAAAPITGWALLLGWLQLTSYAFCLIGPWLFVNFSARRSLRDDSATMHAISSYIIRTSFWMILFVGFADMVISFLRVEELLGVFLSDDLVQKMGRSQFRGPYIHLPLTIAAFIAAAFSRSLGFPWLALLVVVAELTIVITRFVFSYEQAFMGDLVRFWYAGLFLFASAYTLFEDGHVRVDVLYANFTSRTKGMINAVGCLLLGIVLCWVILIIGMHGRANVINSPLLVLEVSQSGYGMYVKYLMAGFLAIYAVSMMIQFTSYLLESIADFFGEPGERRPAVEPPH